MDIAKSTPPCNENKGVARHAASTFGGKPRVSEYLHDSEPIAIDVLICDERPSPGVTSYSTIGLSAYELYRPDGRAAACRLELCGACGSETGEFANIIAAAAFRIMRTGELFIPGSVMTDYVGEFVKSTSVPHLYVAEPYLWDALSPTLDLGTRRVDWLMLVPISDHELQYLRAEGAESLETILGEQQINIFDLKRKSTL